MNNSKLESILVCDVNISELFKVAFKFSESGKFVWFISPEPIMSVPKDLRPSNKEVLKFLTFLYLQNPTELLKHLNSVHTWYRIPELVIIIGFERYLKIDSDDYNSTNGAFICASCLGAGNACANKLNKSIYLIASLDFEKCNENKDHVQVLLDLYFNQISNSSDINIEIIDV